jgi:hypothetical protein
MGRFPRPAEPKEHPFDWATFGVRADIGRPTVERATLFAGWIAAAVACGGAVRSWYLLDRERRRSAILTLRVKKHQRLLRRCYIELGVKAIENGSGRPSPRETTS